MIINHRIYHLVYSEYAAVYEYQRVVLAQWFVAQILR